MPVLAAKMPPTSLREMTRALRPHLMNVSLRDRYESSSHPTCDAELTGAASSNSIGAPWYVMPIVATWRSVFTT